MKNRIFILGLLLCSALMTAQGSGYEKEPITVGIELSACHQDAVVNDFTPIVPVVSGDMLATAGFISAPVAPEPPCSSGTTTYLNSYRSGSLRFEKERVVPLPS